MRDDLIFILLYPSIQQELKKQYGEIKQNYCGNITQIKKLPQGSYLFNVTVQITTFEGAHSPPHDVWWVDSFVHINGITHIITMGIYVNFRTKLLILSSGIYSYCVVYILGKKC
ncbi:DUF3888 domain-containing protein [Bacillus sp. F19]|nr:DUF3888 domain-containing protein [Bacillus sp. F19]